MRGAAAVIALDEISTKEAPSIRGDQDPAVLLKQLVLAMPEPWRDVIVLMPQPPRNRSGLSGLQSAHDVFPLMEKSSQSLTLSGFRSLNSRAEIGRTAGNARPVAKHLVRHRSSLSRLQLSAAAIFSLAAPCNGVNLNCVAPSRAT